MRGAVWFVRFVCGTMQTQDAGTLRQIALSWQQPISKLYKNTKLIYPRRRITAPLGLCTLRIPRTGTLATMV
jgi:hypothetical protein